MRKLTDGDDGARSEFQQVVVAFLAQPGLPFADVFSAERVARIFAKQGHVFGANAVYSTAVMVWSFLGQVLRDGQEASCQAAVARIVSHGQQAGLATPTADTGDYCRARAKLSEPALHDLTKEVAAEWRQQADPAWLGKGFHAKLVDGFPFTMPDTASNQAADPHPRSQKTGVGLPIARATAILSLATASVLDLAMGSYSGKQTGETALLRSLLASFSPEDPLVADRYDCSLLMIALRWSRRVQVCARMHQKRHVDFRRGRRLGKQDHLLVWTKPARPDGMDEATDDALPGELVLRELRFQKELWTTVLGYNLIRTTAAAAAVLHHKQPRQLSFTGTCQYVLATWTLLSSDLLAPTEVVRHCRKLLSQIAQCEVANRPGRIEPRVLKRRRHGYKLMQEPRSVLKAHLINVKAQL